MFEDAKREFVHAFDHGKFFAKGKRLKLTMVLQPRALEGAALPIDVGIVEDTFSHRSIFLL